MLELTEIQNLIMYLRKLLYNGPGQYWDSEIIKHCINRKEHKKFFVRNLETLGNDIIVGIKIYHGEMNLYSNISKCGLLSDFSFFEVKVKFKFKN